MSEEANQRQIQSEIQTVLKRYESDYAEGRKPDILGQYQLLLNEPLEKLSSDFAKAYAVRDLEAPLVPLYALVFDPTTPLRHKNIKALKEHRNPASVAVLDYGNVEISLTSQICMVVILDRPQGITLAEHFKGRKRPAPPSEETLIHGMMRPLMQVLLEFDALGISHNRINLNNVYIHKHTLMLGECISEPAGYSQDSLFEPSEIAQMMPWGKPDYTPHSDCYAFAILSMHLALGFMPFASKDRSQLLNEILMRGSYHALVIEWDFSEIMLDFFRGLLNDARRERWDIKSIASWFTGRKFNLILPSPSREAVRGFDFLGAQYYNRRALVYNMFIRGGESQVVLFDNFLSRWVLTNLNNLEVAEQIERACQSNMGSNARAYLPNMDLLARIMLLLDPIGPIHYHQLCLSLEGFGRLFLHAYLEPESGHMDIVLRLLNSDVFAIWVERQPKNTNEYEVLLAKINRCKTMMKNRALGFGVERCLYDLHPNLPCLSPKLKRYGITTLKDLLGTLDKLAVDKTIEFEFVDRHVAAFIASKLDLLKELNNAALDDIPSLHNNQSLIMAQFYARAYGKIGSPKLPGLTGLVVLSLMPLLAGLHLQTTSEHFSRRLPDVVKRGILSSAVQFFFNKELFIRDHNDFRRAMAVYQQANIKIALLKDKKASDSGGRGIAQLLAYIFCLYTMYNALKNHYHF